MVKVNKKKLNKKQNNNNENANNNNNSNNNNESNDLKSENNTNGLVHQKKKWKNKQRCLLLASRGVGYLARHLLTNLHTLMPHTKTDSKYDHKHGIQNINEIAEIRNCNKVIYVEMQRKTDAFMWITALPHGPSAKFHVQNIHSMEELKLTGNCLKSSRPLLSFNSEFDSQPHWKLLKELFTQTMGTPLYHPKSQPFIDHVLNFSIMDNRIWFRNYQIIDNNGTLAEVGPRFVLNLIKILDGSLSGAVLYENANYIAPILHRRMIREKASIKYNNRIAQKLSIESRKQKTGLFPTDPTDEIFKT